MGTDILEWMRELEALLLGCGCGLGREEGEVARGEAWRNLL